MIMSRVEVRSPGHEEEEDLARLRPGDYFGEMAVLTGEPRSASVVALGDVTLVTMDREAFAELFAREPNAAHALAEVLAQRRATGEPNALTVRTARVAHLVRPQ